MAGGILQLIAQGKQDEIISKDPHITLFKTIYRRHVNFDKTESELNFTGNLDFGGTSSCILKKMGDLVGAMTLMIELPEIDITYLPLTNLQLSSLLIEYGIIWKYDSDKANVLITQSEFEEVVGILTYESGKLIRITMGMINEQIEYLNGTIQKDNLFITTIQTVTNTYIQNNNNNLTEYIDDLVSELLLVNRNLFINDTDYIDNYDYYNEYNYIHSYKKDLPNLIPQEVSWQVWVDSVLAEHFVISYYNPALGLPLSPDVGDMYICSDSDRGWTGNHIYRWYTTTDPITSNWIETMPEIGMGCQITNGYKNMSKSQIISCVGLNKFVIGLFDPSLNGFPQNPSAGDSYICKHYYTHGGITWNLNNIYEWNGTAWDETVPSDGNSIFVLGSGNGYDDYMRTLVYFNGSDWISLYNTPPNNTPMNVVFDGITWRKTIVSFYDPAMGLPTTIIPNSLGNRYVSLSTANGWKINNVYVWDGWEWNEIVPFTNYGVYVEGGTTFPKSIVIFNGLNWEVLSLLLPMYNYNAFKRTVASILQNIIFTDTNVELLYGVENCNTTVIPQTASLNIRTFFDKIVSNEIGSIDTNSAVYKSVYNTYSGFDGSPTSNSAHVVAVQSGLSTAIRNQINTVINFDIRIMTTLLGRLQYVESDTPDYYRFDYYKYFPYDVGTSTYDTSNAVVNCPRDTYNLSSSDTTLLDYFSSYLVKILGTTPYSQFISTYLFNLVGNQTGSTTGTLYDAFMNTNIQSMMTSFFVNTNYDTVLDYITEGVDITYARRIYNLPSCINILTNRIKPNINADYSNFINIYTDNLGGSKGTQWQTLLINMLDYINTNLPTIEQVAFPESLWSASKGFTSEMTTVSTTPDRMMTFIFKYYLPYDVISIIPSEFPFVVSFILADKNPVEYLVMSFMRNLTNYVIYQNQNIDVNYQLSASELTDLTNKLNYIGNAYLDTGLLNYSQFVLHGTNILQSEVPELFPVIDSYHLPYDGITSMTCYLLNQMKLSFNIFYANATNQTEYDNLGNPFMTVNEQFVTDSDFYIYGNQMYNNGYSLINSMVDSYLNDMDRYTNYGSVLKIKNLYLEQSTYSYNYTLNMYVEMHKAIYNGQSYYITNQAKTYADLYTNILSKLDDSIVPLLSYFNSTYNIFMGAMDLLMTDLANRTDPLRTNPYDITNDTARHNWYDEKIITNILNKETNFNPNTVGVIEFFLSTINSNTNPFLPSLNLYNWYAGIERTKVSYEITKMYRLFGLPYLSTNEPTIYSITPQRLYANSGTINNKYNGLADVQDFLQYMLDHLINLSQLGYITKLYKATIEATSESLINYYNDEKSESIDLISKINPYTLTSINGSADYSTLEDLIRNNYNKKPVNFAWIKEVGIYIVDNIQLLIDNAVIDQYNGEYLRIVCKTEGSASQLNGYNKCFGNVPELYTYDNAKKRRYVLYIPVIFTFSKFYQASLPLVCMQFATASVKVKLKKFSQVAYWAQMTKFNKKPRLKCTMLADYIFLDHDERYRVAPLKHEMITEVTQANGDTVIDLSTIKDNTVSVRLKFNGSTKELYFVCQMLENIDGSLPNGELRYNNYLVSVPKNETVINGQVVIQYLDVNPIDTMKIMFNEREREKEKEIMFYSCVQRLQHNNVSDYDGINVYSFALTPQILQPSGTANLGIMGYVDLVITFRQDVMDLVGNNKKLMRIAVYNKSVNLLRIMSGLAGLAFYS